ncbi:MAG: SDR family oxidoreductase [Dehalococcoidia bacterium]|nr:SDR family oxidoreductase [Dehalococcoidia bacterium]
MNDQEILGLRDKVAVVTGAGQGIGRAIALLLAKAGANVVAVDIDATGAKDTARAVTKLDRKSMAITADVTKLAEVKAMVKQVVSKLGSVDILINNVGGRAGYDYTWTEEVDEKQFYDVLDISLKSTFFCSTECAKIMMKHGKGGAIVHIGSLSGHIAAVRHAIYGAAKAGVMQMAMTMAVEWGPYGIRVNVVSPGSTLTPRFQVENTPDAQAGLAQATPLARIGRAEDVAGAVLYLVSDMASFVTGQCITVDGGVSVNRSNPHPNLASNIPPKHPVKA